MIQLVLNCQLLNYPSLLVGRVELGVAGQEHAEVGWGGGRVVGRVRGRRGLVGEVAALRGGRGGGHCWRAGLVEELRVVEAARLAVVGVGCRAVVAVGGRVWVV